MLQGAPEAMRALRWVSRFHSPGLEAMVLGCTGMQARKRLMAALRRCFSSSCTVYGFRGGVWSVQVETAGDAVPLAGGASGHAELQPAPCGTACRVWHVDRHRWP